MTEEGEGLPVHAEQAKPAERYAPGNHELRRDYQIRKVAHDRGISLESYSAEPAVQSLATVIKDTQDLRLNFENPSSTYVEQDMGEHSLRERYGTARALLRTSQAILDEGFPKQMWEHSVYSLGYPLHDAVSPYGLTIKKMAEPSRIHNPPDEVFPPPDGAWHDPQTADFLAPPTGDHRWWSSRLDPDDLYEHPDFIGLPILPEEKQEWLQRCQQEATRLGVSAEDLKNPQVIHFLAQLSEARRLLAEQEKCREISSEPKGLIPSARERVLAASHLTRAVVMVLEDGLGANTLSREDLANEVTLATKPYGWQVEFVEPDSPRTSSLADKARQRMQPPETLDQGESETR
ncbi:hypothetical protein [Streptomyces cinerochromogenes]|uniref:hypothetical protein n=1 Tax=Streptomyces cinerochromogenes TaxID=66422 RepID=UPI0016709000|nr:hypothetical protein [Streptomyces cinerochromogenes]GGS82793.1 hypothetical protein GCM10010206_51710 [Streptomyces cinerochromogenes]